MSGIVVAKIASGALVGVVALGAARQAQAQHAKNPYMQAVAGSGFVKNSPYGQPNL